MRATSCCAAPLNQERMLRTREGGRRKRNISLFSLSLSLSPSFTSLALSLTPLHILWILHECIRVALRCCLRLLRHCDAAAARCCAERRPSHLHMLQLALLCCTIMQHTPSTLHRMRQRASAVTIDSVRGCVQRFRGSSHPVWGLGCPGATSFLCRSNARMRAPTKAAAPTSSSSSSSGEFLIKPEAHVAAVCVRVYVNMLSPHPPAMFSVLLC